LLGRNETTLPAHGTAHSRAQAAVVSLGGAFCSRHRDRSLSLEPLDFSGLNEQPAVDEFAGDFADLHAVTESFTRNARAYGCLPDRY
jgi:hypothetical protein